MDGPRLRLFGNTLLSGPYAAVRAALPMEEGVILDPFMGSGSTIAAATAMGLESVGLETVRLQVDARTPRA